MGGGTPYAETAPPPLALRSGGPNPSEGDLGVIGGPVGGPKPGVPGMPGVSGMPIPIFGVGGADSVFPAPITGEPRYGEAGNAPETGVPA